MMHAVLPEEFQKQKLVNITMIETDPLLTGLLVDNVRYTVNK